MYASESDHSAGSVELFDFKGGQSTMSRLKLAVPCILCVVALLLGACGSGEEETKELNIFAWSDEVPAELVEEFEAETGISVTIDTFDSNESLIAKLEAGASGYDVITPSQYAVQILGRRGLLMELDHSRLENFENISDVFNDPVYDPGLQYSIPYFWGTTGLAYNDECVEEEITSWEALWDPQYEGRIYMLDNMLAAYIPALQINGFSANSSDPEEIEIATQTLIDQKPLLAGYNSTNFAELVSSGEACVVEAWSGSIGVLDNPHVHYVLPDEGGTMWVDSFAVVADAPHVDAAYQWLDFMLQGEVAAKATELSGMATANNAAREFMDPAIAENEAVYPPDERLANCDFILDVGEAMQYYQDGWTEVKATSE